MDLYPSSIVVTHAGKTRLDLLRDHADLHALRLEWLGRIDIFKGHTTELHERIERLVDRVDVLLEAARLTGSTTIRRRSLLLIRSPPA